jgi:hypothetical protein
MWCQTNVHSQIDNLFAQVFPSTMSAHVADMVIDVSFVLLCQCTKPNEIWPLVRHP